MSTVCIADFIWTDCAHIFTIPMVSVWHIHVASKNSSFEHKAVRLQKQRLIM